MAEQDNKPGDRSFTLEEFNCKVHIVSEELTKEHLLGFIPFQNWKQSLKHALSLQQDTKHPWKIESIRVLSVVWFPTQRGPPRPGFIKLEANVVNDNPDKKPNWVPGTVFLRGDSVAVLVRLILIVGRC